MLFFLTDTLGIAPMTVRGPSRCEDKTPAELARLLSGTVAEPAIDRLVLGQKYRIPTPTSSWVALRPELPCEARTTELYPHADVLVQRRGWTSFWD